LVGRRIDIELNVRVSLRRIVVALPFSPAGSRNKASPAIDALLDGEAATLTRKALELAKAAAEGELTPMEVGEVAKLLDLSTISSAAATAAK
jgi:hypothetical protein